jgi:glycosyltransferase involved in cell wall biosynthesis
VAGLDEYAANMGAARIVVNLPRTVTNRPHRILDAMAAGACVLTGPIPTVDGDDLQDRIHYRSFADTAEVPGIISELLADHAWTQYAINGHELVMARHTWAIRAQELRQIIKKELGL